jgi:hypothetical protein
MKHKLIFSIIALLLQVAVSAQYFSGKKDIWKNRRHSLSFGIGFSNFLGELGGRDQIGSDFIYDLEWAETRPSLLAAYRYRLGERFYAKGQFAFAIVGGNDALTEEIFRRNRNLNFRSTLFELTAQVEFDVVQFGQNNRRYNALKKNRHTSAIYLSLGVGAVRFNPKGNLSGTYYALRPLSTEGQGLPDGPEEYSLFSLVIPMGVGYRFDINRDWAVGLEIVHRVTFTDYMDDASTVYYDNEIIRQTNGELAAYFADPSLGYYVDEDTGDRVPLNSTFTGAQRGDPEDNDAYFTVMVTGTYTLPYKRYTRGRGRSVKRRKGRAVF